MDEPEPVLRRACDRCHAQKLSCQRSNNEPCARCRRVHAQCTTSPSLRNRRPRHTDRARHAASTRAERPFESPQCPPVGIPAPTTPDGGQGALVHELDMVPWAGVGHFSEIPLASDFDGAGLFPNLFDPDRLPTPFLAQPPEFHSQDFGTVTSKNYDDAIRGAPDELLSSSTAPGQSPESTLVAAHVSTSARTHSEDSGSLAGSSDSTGIFSSHTSSHASPRWLQTLVEINVQLFSLASNKDDQVDSPDGDGHIGPPGNGFDKILLLAQRLLRTLCALYGSAQPDRDTRGIVHLRKPWVPQTNLDTGSTLIIMSCHVRWIELLMDRLVRIMDIMSETKGLISHQAHATAAQSANTASRPTLTAFTCSLDAFPILRLRITLELIEHTVDMLRRALVPLVSHSSQSIGHHNLGDGPGKMPDVSEKLLLARDEEVYELIADIRKKLSIARRV
ncbi:hypothetical protein F4808DRAFT_464194 [Astrocystis sublimbata]|nr:hypothetical protein F4808DRAFT_464194 [Astrocystis sublimbata]